MAAPTYDSLEDLKAIKAELLPGEAVEGIFDLLTTHDTSHRRVSRKIALLAVTNKRMVMHSYQSYNSHKLQIGSFSILYSAIISMGIQRARSGFGLIINMV